MTHITTDAHPANGQPNNSTNSSAEYRNLPGVDALLQQADELIERYGPLPVTEAIRAELDLARQAIRQGGEAPKTDAWLPRLAEHLARRFRPSLRPVINATGVIVHTNLGRAPLSAPARQALTELTTGYNTLEYDLAAGARGSRNLHPRKLLCELTGAEDALVVNNCASAVFFILAALCKEKEVIISRGELVEIGGGFRIPDVLRQSDARLVEVGTTNRTHPRDFANAIGDRTGALMRVHSSNFRQIGFVTMPGLDELVRIAHETPFPVDNEWGRPLVIDDLGSGTLIDTTPYGLAPEPTAQASVAAGADVIAFSGDKLLGGPQAGIIVGKADVIARLRQHPLARALRVDKMTLAALTATLESYVKGRALEEIPVWRMIAASPEAVRERAELWRESLAERGVSTQVIPSQSTVGGGSLPGETLPTVVLALSSESPDQAAQALRQLDPPIICRIQDDRLLFDPRTVLPEQESLLLAGILALYEESAVEESANQGSVKTEVQESHG